MSRTKPHFHNVVQAGIVIGETGEKLARREPSKLLKLRVF